MSRTALVTGAARRIGRTIALDLARAGYSLAVHARKSDDPDALSLCGEIRNAGGKAALVAADLENRAEVSRLVALAEAALGPVTVVVNNASLFEHDGAGDFGDRLWDAHMEVNLHAPLTLARDMAAALPDGQTGDVINIIDQRVWRLNPNFFTYTLSKSALWTATRTMAQALGPRVRVNAIGPGPTLRNARQSEADFSAQIAALPLQRATEPQEIAAAVRYILGAPALTGQMLALDGGQHLAWKTPDISDISE